MKKFSKATRTAASAFIAANLTEDRSVKAAKNAHLLGKANAKDVIDCIEQMRMDAWFLTKAKAAKMSVTKYKAIKARLQAVANCFETGHSMGSVTTVRAGHYKHKYAGAEFDKWKVEAFNDTTQTYDKSCTWKPVHGSLLIELTIKEAESVEIIGGVPTIKINEVAPGIFSVKVWEMEGSKGSAKIVTRNMFLAGDYHAETIEEAQTKREIAIASQKEQAKAKRRFVGLQHSEKVGNCEIGTKAFAQRHGLDIEMGYSVEYLLSLEPQNTYVQRFLKHSF